jgi:hypothetical protein
MEEITAIKKRKLSLNRETVMPLQHDQLDDVYGGKGKKGKDDSNIIQAASQSGGASAIVSGVVTALAAESASACAVVSGAASASASAIDHASNKLGVPCWAATSAGSAIIHFTRKW